MKFNLIQMTGESNIIEFPDQIDNLGSNDRNQQNQPEIVES